MDSPLVNPTSKSENRTLLLDKKEIQVSIQEIAKAILQQHAPSEKIILVGIPTRGVEVARRIISQILQTTGLNLELGILDISMHRDDLATRIRMTALEMTHLPVTIENRTIILVDDVLFTGRSVRAAMDAISSYGRPGRIELAVLIDRGNRQLPIAANYTGKIVTTRFEERIRVRFQNLDGQPDSVSLIQP